MNRLREFCCTALIAALLAGCASPPVVEAPQVVAAPAKDEADEVAELLNYYRHLVVMSVAHQQREYQDALAGFARHPGELQRLRLALLLTLPQVAWHDDARAMQLLASSANTPAGQAAPRSDLALLIHGFVTERLRLAREEQRKAAEANQRWQGQLAERQRQLLDAQRQAEELERKLDALRKIDRKALRRSTGR